LNTKLRLLIDESIEDPLADIISDMSAFNVVCVRDLSSVKGKSDKNVMACAQEDDRIVLTTDTGFNKGNYPICTHHGIIRISPNCRHSSAMAESVRQFAQCGHRVAAKHSITVIHQEGYTIETIDKGWSHRYR